MTLRARLLLALVCIVAAGIGVSDVVTYASLRSFLLSRLDQQLVAAPPAVNRALVVCANQAANPLFGSASAGCQLPLGLAPQVPPGTFGELRTADGSEIHGFFGAGPQGAAQPVPQLPAALPVSADAQNPSIFTVTGRGPGGATYEAVAVPTDRGGIVVVAVPLSDISQTLGRLVLIELLVSAAVVAGLGALAWFVVRQGLRPLDQMAQTAGAIAAGDLSRRVHAVDERTEVGKLAGALNTMLGEIERAFAARAASEERMRRFLADASHELRTPLTSIRGYAEMFDRGARDRPEDLATSMRHIRAEADRMSVLVEDLLLLARLDRPRPLDLAPVDLAGVATSAVDAARAAHPERAIGLQAAGPVVVDGDADRLRQVVDNLVTNACQYSAPGQPVTVRVRSWGGSAVLEVEDRGPGVPPAERARIFEPFHRADSSRARSTGGVGLGLAIVSAIARAHGGTVEVADAPAGGAVFRVAMPLAAAGSTHATSVPVPSGTG